MRIMIVEDEKFTREAIAKDILGIGNHQVAQAVDGIHALEIVNEFQPELILADIRMPRMDGLALLKEIKNAYPKIVFIIISSHESFEYAQIAIQNGALSYLLKPFDIEDLKGCLLRVEFLFNKEKEANNWLNETEQNARKHKELSKKYILKEWIENDSLQLNEIDFNSRLKGVDITFPYSAFIVISVNIDSLNQLIALHTHPDLQLFLFCIENITEEIIGKLNINVHPFESEGSLSFLLNSPVHPNLPEQITGACQEIVRTISKLMKFTITIGIGCEVQAVSNLHTSYAQSKKATLSNLGKGGNQVFKYIEAREESLSPKVLIDYEIETQLLLFMEACDKASALHLITGLYNQTKEQNRIGEPADFMKLNFHISIVIFKLMNQLKLHPEELFYSEIKLYKQLNNCTSFQEMLEVIAYICDKCFEEITTHDRTWNNTLITKAMNYLLKHYNEDISLQSVSKQLFISSPYLSRQFKKVYNQNFTDFLINYRINKAKEFLLTGQYTASEVSALIGFKDDKHFFRTFKKITGLTPRVYKLGNFEQTKSSEK
ncbi:response regulator [Paenibacillus psychroresistens]|uniref:Response regulator n=1 Tax=Paenibacillus psychroresistens TaxID=1778678 RepID=A0A6B8RSA1_9BACL|nr:response regulator [Paenibacillus psychroresistens]QGQ98777.1 response regulator [Paenibacillus psychroresistens]